MLAFFNCMFSLLMGKLARGKIGIVILSSAIETMLLLVVVGFDRWLANILSEFLGMETAD